ncbi:DUF4870 domain-containing protein [Subtercola endophyticus]|uniref:DUF4870 domain-containing protein n=1 Tax=Subtercola endophyticus TaxID=2895559 RepID=UPI001E2FA0EB|nr:DUF4870 domain-containing protein [Subtercola endophyticus]UFS60749.1 DUF4870 domain-containing protein [Subtercola endophyticus]
MSNVPPPPAQPPVGGPPVPPPPGPPVPPPGPPVPPPGGYAPQAPLSPSDQRLWATLIHIGGIIFGFLPPLIGYLVLKDRGEFIQEHTKTALNFQLTILIAYIVGSILSIVLIGVFILIAAWIIDIIFSIIAALAANKGELYTYPKWCAIQFVK